MSQPPAPWPPPPPPKALEDIIAKQCEDHEGVVATLHSLTSDFQVADRAKLDMVLQQFSATLKSV